MGAQRVECPKDRGIDLNVFCFLLIAFLSDDFPDEVERLVSASNSGEGTES